MKMNRTIAQIRNEIFNDLNNTFGGDEKVPFIFSLSISKDNKYIIFREENAKVISGAIFKRLYKLLPKNYSFYVEKDLSIIIYKMYD